jgi:hypothetical protein
MIVVDITRQDLEKAEKLYSFECLNNSVMGGKSNIYGAIGEVALEKYLKSKNRVVDFESTFDYDMIVSGKKIDVKTKRTTVVPKDDYLCSVAAFNTKQRCDYYVFARVSEKKDVAYILGYMSKEDFYSMSIFYKRGDIDVNGFVFKTDNYSIKVKDLNKF